MTKKMNPPHKKVKTQDNDPIPKRGHILAALLSSPLAGADLDLTREKKKERPIDLFHQLGFEIPADFDELPEDELKAWKGECD